MGGFFAVTPVEPRIDGGRSPFVAAENIHYRGVFLTQATVLQGIIILFRKSSKIPMPQGFRGFFIFAKMRFGANLMHTDIQPL